MSLLLSACCFDTGCAFGNVLVIAGAEDATEAAVVIVILNGAELATFEYSDTEQCLRPTAAPGAELCVYWTSPGRINAYVDFGEAPGDVGPMDRDVIRVRFEEGGRVLSDQEGVLDYEVDQCIGREPCPPFALVQL